MSRLFHRNHKLFKPTSNDMIVNPDSTEPGPGLGNNNNIVFDLPGLANDLDSTKKSNFKTIQHMKSYPLVQETKVILDGCPFTRVVIATSKPKIKKIMNSKPLQVVSPITNFFDSIANSSLNLTDKIIPSLKTKTYKRIGDEIKYPFSQTKKGSKAVANTLVTTTGNYVCKPVHNKIVDFRKYYNKKYYDTKGKPIVRGTLDPVILPVNNALENVTHKYLPNGKTVNPDGFSCEFDRCFALNCNAVARLLPVISTTATTMAMAPCNYFVHVNKTINNELDKKDKLTFGNAFSATWSSMGILERETWDNLKSGCPMKFFAKKPTVREETLQPIEQVEVVVDDVVSNVVQAVQEVQEETRSLTEPRTPHEITVPIN